MLLLALTTNAIAQPVRKVPLVGYISSAAAAGEFARTEAFRQGLRELGYVEGKTVVIDWRFADGKVDRLSELAAELVRRKADVIVTAGPTSTRAARRATAAIPIVMSFDSDPVGSGFVASLARPGGNTTGLSALSPEISGKQLEILKEIIPTLSRVAVFGDPNNPGTQRSLKETEVAAKAIGVKLQYLDIPDPAHIESAFQAAIKGRSDAVLVLASSVASAQRLHITELASKNRLPAIYPHSDYMEAGGLIFYGPSITDLFRRAATYVDKILKGANPAELPVEQPTKFEVVINLKTAKQIGLTIPPNVLARAERVIK